MRKALPWLILVAIISLIILSMVSMKRQSAIKTRLTSLHGMEDDIDRVLSKYMQQMEDKQAQTQTD